MAEFNKETMIMEFGARRPEQKIAGHCMELAKKYQIPTIPVRMESTSELLQEKQEYVDEFRINMELYGDADHFGLLVISDSRKNALNPLPQKSIPIEKATLEAVGVAVMEYLRENCLEK